MQNADTTPITRVEISDYAAFGRKVVEWATDPATRPKDLAAFKQQISDFATVPERITDFEIVQSTLEKLYIRLPPAEMAKEGLARVQGLGPDDAYKEPRFYKDKIVSDDVGNLEFFFSRVGDYTIAQCM